MAAAVRARKPAAWCIHDADEVVSVLRDIRGESAMSLVSRRAWVGRTTPIDWLEGNWMEREMPEHSKHVCRHGVVVSQCRCPGPKTETVVACPPQCTEGTALPLAATTGWCAPTTWTVEEPPTHADLRGMSRKQLKRHIRHLEWWIRSKGGTVPIPVADLPEVSIKRGGVKFPVPADTAWRGMQERQVDHPEEKP